MKKGHLVYSFVMWLLVFYSCSPKTTAPSMASNSSLYIINTYLNKIGCVEKCEDIKTVELFYSMSMMGMDMTVMKIYNEKLGFFSRIETDYRVFYEQIYNYKLAFERHSGGTDTFTSGDRYNLIESSATFLPQRFYAASDHQLRILGIDTVSLMNCHKVSINDMTHEYYEIETGLLKRQSKEQVDKDGQLRQLVEDYESYEDFDGLLLPTVVTISGMGPVDYAMTLDSVFYNRAVEEKLFHITTQ